MLLPDQQGDVAFFERRLLTAKGHGVLTTNGTGTGKTFSGLGLIKRYARMGRDNIIIVVPNNKIASDWAGSGRALSLNIQKLDDTQDNGGSGVVITTYANFRDNNSLLDREWDLLVFDESHYLRQADSFDTTQAEDMRNALTGHPRGRMAYHYKRHAEEYQQLREMADSIKSKQGLRNLDDTTDQMRDSLQKDIDQLQKKSDRLRSKLQAAADRDVEQRAELWEQNRTDTLMLSATPFPYRFSVDSAEGYLFDYETQKTGEDLRYNNGNAREQFFITNFGYRMRYNKLTQPESGVDLGLMEREFANRLQKEGVMRSRMLDVDQDYDRQFYEVESQVGRKVDEGLMWMDKEAESSEDQDLKDGLRELAHKIRENFDYLSRAYFLEAVKAKEMVPVIREHLALGRKVVVFHDFNKGGSANPFKMPELLQATADGNSEASRLELAYRHFHNKRQDLLKLPLNDLVSPRTRLQAAFPDALFFNGQVSKGERIKNADTFNDDDSGKNLIVVQSDAGREGVSLHDTSGKHQRVLINLGLPSKPIASIQAEGRIFRTFVQSNAVQRYVSTGLSMERWAIASKLAARSGTAENLAMGDQARGLKEAILEAYETAGEYPPGHEGEGTGGKAKDRALIQPMSDFQRAKTYYFGTAKNAKSRGQREGKDYYATPEPLGQKMVEWADVAPNERVLEPSAGHGAILRWMGEDRDVHFVEPSTELASKAALRAPHGKYHDGNFEDLALQNKYDAVVMNPPYGQGGSTAWKHVAKAAKHLRDGGRIVALVPQGPAADKAQQRYLESKEAKEIYTAGEILMPTVTFERAGTSVKTKVVILERHTSHESAPAPFSRSVEYAEDINEFFDEIEGMAVPNRARPEPSVTAMPDGEADTLPRLETAETVHAKKGIDLFVAKVANRITDYQNFLRIKSIAQENGGYYSKFSKNGAIPGFQFESESDRADFLKAAEPVMEQIRDEQRAQLKRGASLTGMPTESVQSVVDRVTRKWSGAPRINVVSRLEDLPVNLVADIYRQGAQNVAEAALFDGEVYILASRMESPEMVEAVILHEVVGHYGVKRIMGSEIKPFYNTVYLKMGKSPMAEAIKKSYFDPASNPFDPKKTAHRHIVADELIAHLAERNDHNSLWSRFVAMFRERLRRLGFTLDLSKNDVLMILRKAQEAMMNGGVVRNEGQAYREKEAQLSVPISRQAETATFDSDSADIRLRRGDVRPGSDPSRENRLSNFWNGIASQPIDRMFRMVFDVAGLVDSHGRLKPGVKISDMAEHTIKNWQPHTKGAFSWLNGPLELARNGLMDRYKLTSEYKQVGREAEAYGRKIDMQAMDILKTLQERGVDGDEAMVLQDLLTGEQVDNDRLKGLAPDIQRAIDDLGQQAVEYGIISRESFERNRGQYLHRSYLKYEGEFTGLGKFVHNLQRKRNRSIEGDTAKGRGKFVKVKVGDITRHLPDDWFGLKKENGKVDRQKLNRQKFMVLEDPGIITEKTEQMFHEDEVDQAQKRRQGRRVYWPASKPLPPKWRDWTNHGTFEVRSSVGERVILWRDWTKKERRSMGEIIDARYNIAKTFQKMSQDLASGKLFHDIAQNREWFSHDVPQDGGTILDPAKRPNLVNLSSHDWVQVPDTSIDKTGGTKRWGALAGGYVRAEIYRDLLELDKMHNPGAWRKLLTQWKLNKTARSPVVHTNNVMSNLVFMDMADVRFTDLAKGVRSYRKRDQYWREAQENGAFEGTFINEEIRRQVLDPILEEIAKQDQAFEADIGGKMQYLSKMAGTIWRFAKKADRTMVNTYQLEDEIFRMAMYIRRRELGDSELDAAIMAREQFLDYDIRAPWVNAARRTVLPFIAYTYRAVPVITRSMLHRPWKLAKYATIAYMVEELAFAMAGGDEDEERRTMREQEQGMTWIGTNRMLRMPYNDDYGNPVYLDIRRWIPAGDVFDMNQGQSAVPVPAPVQFGGPLMLAFEFALNKQAFTGDEIVSRDTDTPAQQVQKTASWLYKSWMPSAAYIPGSYYWDKSWRAFEGGRDILGRPYSGAQALISSTGIKLKPHDVQLGYAFRAMDLEKQADKVRLEIRQAQRDLNRNLIDQERFDEIRERSEQKLQMLQDKVETLRGW